jgi:hypothetical protein
MKSACFVAIFSLIATGACGPVESLPQPDAGPPPSDAGVVCPGVCVKANLDEWVGPELVWMGDEADAPPCPTIALLEGFTGHGYVDGPIHCGACSCGPTSGSCMLPATVTAAAASCAGDGSGVAHTSSDPPAGWAGLCNGESAIPAGKLCGGVPCVQSITIAPAMPVQTGCLPIANTNASPPPWNRFARACRTTASRDGCPANDEVCTAAAPGPEFKQCISIVGNIAAWECPASYPERSIFYDRDVPTCAPCACDFPTGSTCTGSIELYQDGSCSTPLGTSISINATDPVCVDVPPGSGLGSKSATSVFYQPGSCTPSGGTPEGKIFCCVPQ